MELLLIYSSKGSKAVCLLNSNSSGLETINQGYPADLTDEKATEAKGVSCAAKPRITSQTVFTSNYNAGIEYQWNNSVSTIHWKQMLFLSCKRGTAWEQMLHFVPSMQTCPPNGKSSILVQLKLYIEKALEGTPAKLHNRNASYVLPLPFGV